MSMMIDLMEMGLLPDTVIRRGIRRLLRQRLQNEDHGDCEVNLMRQQMLFSQLRESPLTGCSDPSQSLRHGLPATFFSQVLGPRRSISCCLYPIGVNGIAAAEEAMLSEICRRAAVEDDMDILELGCGWGSLTLWMAERFPLARITALACVRQQQEYVQAVCDERGFSNVHVVFAQMNSFELEETFDRVISVALFEQMRNYAELLRRISCWLRPDGKLFAHLFCHRELAYLFDTEDEDNWMGRFFFTGGIMPSDRMLFYFNDDLLVEEQWRVNGRHYQQTCEDWLTLLEARGEQVMPILRDVYADDAELWFQRWRVFFMACSELFGYNSGNEWFVGQYLLQQRRA